MMKHIPLFTHLRLSTLGMLTAGSLALMSCGAQFNAGSETDGAYYDPRKDNRPERVYAQTPSSQGWDYQEEEDYPEPDPSEGIIAQNRKNIAERENRYQRYNRRQETSTPSYAWGNPASSSWGTENDSDFGYYQGETTQYFNSYAWGNPWGLGYGSPFGYWGWGGYGGWNRWNLMSYSPWFYDPFFYGGTSVYWGVYNPYYMGYYSYPYWGYGGHWASPYYGNLYGGGYGRPVYRARGADAIYRGNDRYNTSGFENGPVSTQGSSTFRRGQDSGFRTGGLRRMEAPSPQYRGREYQSTPQNQGAYRSRGFRRVGGDGPSNESYRQSMPSPQRSFENRSWGGSSDRGGSWGGNQGSGGFRTGGFRTGGFR